MKTLRKKLFAPMVNLPYSYIPELVKEMVGGIKGKIITNTTKNYSKPTRAKNVYQSKISRKPKREEIYYKPVRVA